MLHPESPVLRPGLVVRNQVLCMSTSKITEVILGVDKHLDIHVGVLINVNGQLLGTLAVETQVSGYLKLLAWAKSFGLFQRGGIEGTGTYGAGLALVLRDHDIAFLRSIVQIEPNAD